MSENAVLIKFFFFLPQYHRSAMHTKSCSYKCLACALDLLHAKNALQSFPNIRKIHE